MNHNGTEEVQTETANPNVPELSSFDEPIDFETHGADVALDAGGGGGGIHD